MAEQRFHRPNSAFLHKRSCIYSLRRLYPLRSLQQLKLYPLVQVMSAHRLSTAGCRFSKVR